MEQKELLQGTILDPDNYEILINTPDKDLTDAGIVFKQRQIAYLYHHKELWKFFDKSNE